ncbi:MAG TPA: PQ-loop domain-containing transporter [Microlunatus sp.]
MNSAERLTSAAPPGLISSPFAGSVALRKVHVVFTETLGWVAAVVGTLVALPQVIRLLRSGTAAGISLLAWQATLGANIAWSAHGFAVGHLNILLPNLLCLIYSFVVLSQLRRHRGLGWLRTLGPAVLLGLVTFGLDVTVGTVAFAIAAFLPSAVAQLAQLHALIIAANIRGVSLTFLVASVVNQALWVSWSVLANETSVTLVATSLGSLMALNLVVGLLRRFRVVRARLSAMSA